MKTATDWRSALCLAIGLLVCFAGPLRAAPAALQRPFQRDLIAHGDGSPPTASRNLTDPRPAARNEIGVADPAAQEVAQKPPVVLTSNDEPAATASTEHSVRDKTSLIGKILIGIGTLLTLASAARMLVS